MKNDYNLAWGSDVNQDERQLQDAIPASEADALAMHQESDLIAQVTGEIRIWVRELKVVKAEIKTLEERENFLKSQILERMGDAEMVVDEDGVEVVTYKSSTVKRFNQSRFKQDQPELISEYTDTFDVKRFVVK